jgi:beta-glucosidase
MRDLRRASPLRRAPLGALLLLLALHACLPLLAQPAPSYPFNNVSLPAAERAADLLSRLTLHEKVGMLFMDASMAYGNDTLPKGGDLPSTAVPRLGVPQFNWMSQGSVYRGAANGCILGCCSACPPSSPPSDGVGGCCHDGFATQLPQGMGMAATFDAELVFAAGVMASDESRGIQNGFPGGAAIADYRTGASSVINILRDGRWGRAPEGYGECPFLTGSTAVAFNKGIMGYPALNATARQYGEYVKVLPVIRHFVAYAGPDSGRFSFDAVVSEDDLRLTFLPAWAALVREGAIGGVMSAISALNSIPSAAHKSLLVDYLKGELGFPGFVISDCDTISAISTDFHYAASVEQAVAAAIQGGGDINCGPEYVLLLNATADGLVSEEEDIDPAVLRALTARVMMGDLDPPSSPPPYTDIPYSVVNSPEHQALARQIVAASVVLLQNDAEALPFAVAPPPSQNIAADGGVGGEASRSARGMSSGGGGGGGGGRGGGGGGSPSAGRFAQYTGWELPCGDTVGNTCLTGWSTCDGNSVPGQCSFPRASASDLCAAWPACAAVTCNPARDDCQARAWGPQLMPSSGFVTLARVNPLRNLLVVGPSANDTSVQAHTYHGTPQAWVTVLDALTSQLAGAGVNVTYVYGCGRSGGDRSGFPAALAAVQSADAVLYVGGLEASMEEEDTDRGDFALPGVQLPLIQALYNATLNASVYSSIPMAVLVISGGPVSEPWMTSPGAAGLAWAWVSYFGQAGDGIADVLLGAVSPSGRLPYTMPVDTSQVGDITDYDMRGPPFGRTYRYLQYSAGAAAIPLFPFGHGMSYSNVSVVALTVPPPAVANVSSNALSVVASVVNTGPMAADFVVAVFGEFCTCSGQPSPVPALPLRTLLAYTKLRAVQPDGNVVAAQLSIDLSNTPGAARQPLPGLLRLWAGDGGTCDGCPSATVELVLGSSANCSSTARMGREGETVAFGGASRRRRRADVEL